MFWQKLSKVGDSYIVTIPNEEVERPNLCEGQLLAIEILPVVINSDHSTELDVAFDESWQRNESGYRYLAEHLSTFSLPVRYTNNSKSYLKLEGVLMYDPGQNTTYDRLRGRTT